MAIYQYNKTILSDMDGGVTEVRNAQAEVLFGRLPWSQHKVWPVQGCHRRHFFKTLYAIWFILAMYTGHFGDVYGSFWRCTAHFGDVYGSFCGI